MVNYTCQWCEYHTIMKTNYNKHVATKKHKKRVPTLCTVLTAEEIKVKQKPKTKKDLLLEIVQLKKEIAELKSNI